MIICPNCKEEIDDDSHYCDQCGQPLAYCERCGRVGMGRRCTACGGLMISADEYQRRIANNGIFTSSTSISYMSMSIPSNNGIGARPYASPPAGMSAHPVAGIPQMVLFNDSLNIRIIAEDGAIIGRREGPYSQLLKQQKYVSGIHAQLRYKAGMGWCVADRNSSNGTKLNDHQLQPDVEMSLKNDDILTIANVNLRVKIY
ncbi:FHA domain-containing protein [Prevotella sp. E13-17]|uniref:FHA domain-containing protein n=1 Tax=Prevotella sp. E13-17 TaxID=2913616 RepID=UPI001EDA941D|nr:FHA domain-containing protein [Prevotella sp. E13-17]UKK52081.1 FHA domain-containing protein [Prevotella sp. E13-17]